MYLSTANDIFPLAWLLKQVPSALFYYEAFTECEIYRLPREDYLAFINSNQAILHGELERAVRRDVAVTLRLNALLQSKANTKLILRCITSLMPMARRLTMPRLNLILFLRSKNSLT